MNPQTVDGQIEQHRPQIREMSKELGTQLVRSLNPNLMLGGIMDQAIS